MIKEELELTTEQESDLLSEDDLKLEDEELIENDITLEQEEENELDLQEEVPPPPTKEHKVVTQLDDVNKDSEIKASEILDKLDFINTNLSDIEDYILSLQKISEKNVELFSKLSEKYPNIESFQKALQDNQDSLTKLSEITQHAQNSSDDIMTIMDIMQYQDIHRQKIERVISVMRALSRYMNSLFDSDIKDDSRASTANHITGDSNDIVSEDDIEALLESFGKK